MGWHRVILDVIVFICVFGGYGNASVSSVQTAKLIDRLARRPAFLEGRRGDMDDNFDVVRADLSAVVDRRDNRTPGQREVALASLEILVSGEKVQTTTEKPKVQEVTRRPPRPCLNGGIRLLKSFCYCPPKFMGRHCEIYRYNSSCGRVPHGRYIYIDCNTCYCFAGVLKCQSHPLEGCEGESTTQHADAGLDGELNGDEKVALQDGFSEFGNSAPTRLPHLTFLFASLSSYVMLCSLLTRQRGR